MSRIAIEGMHFHAYHGYYPEERTIGCKYVVDVYIRLSIEEAGKSDHIKHTLNYEKIYAICQEEMDEQRKLVETVAVHIGERIRKEFKKKARKVKVRIAKLHPPLRGQVERFVVEYTG